MPEKTRFMQCPEKHTIPVTPQFYARKLCEEKDADGMPMFEHGLWCSVCEKPYSLSKLKETDGDENALFRRHNLEVILYVAQNPLPP